MKNPFRRKKKPHVEFPNDEVFWIPGNWNDRSEIVGSIAKNNMNEFVFAGYIMLNMNTQESFGIQILEKSDFDNLDFFGKFKDSEFFIRMDLTESEYNQQESIIKAGNAILKAGGLSIFAEKSSLIYSAESWNT